MMMLDTGLLDLVATAAQPDGLLDSLVSIEFSWAVFGLLVLTLAALGQPLFVILGGITAYLLLALPDASGNPESITGALNALVEETRKIADKPELLAIPFFVLAGAIMTAGDIAQRLVNVARAAFGWIRGGLAFSAVAACVFFAAISGSSPVTVIAIGTMMYPVLLEEKYSEKFSAGLLTSAGSLGILIPPSIPMLIYAIVFLQLPEAKIGQAIPSASGLDFVGALFLAGIGPGLLIGLALGGFSIVEGIKRKVPTTPFSWAELKKAVSEGMWALMLPVLILGGIYSGVFTVTAAAAVAVVYSFFVEVFIHGGLELHKVPKIFAESAVLMGVLLIIIAMALGFNSYLIKAEIPEAAVALIKDWDMSLFTFLLVLNILLLIVGCLMDIMSAILILVPLLAPIALEMGVHPIHLGIIFIVNLEIGYLTPPLGLNLFVASTIFNKSIGEIIKSVVPFSAIMFGCVLIITYVPAISLGGIALLSGQSPFVTFDDPLKPGDGSENGEKSVGELVSAEGQELRESADISFSAESSMLLFESFISEEETKVILSKLEVLTTEEFETLVAAMEPANMEDENTRHAFIQEIAEQDAETLKKRIAEGNFTPTTEYVAPVEEERKPSGAAKESMEMFQTYITPEEMAAVVAAFDKLESEEFDSMTSNMEDLDPEELKPFIALLPDMTPGELKARIASDDMLEKPTVFEKKMSDNAKLSIDMFATFITPEEKAIVEAKLTVLEIEEFETMTSNMEDLDPEELKAFIALLPDMDTAELKARIASDDMLEKPEGTPGDAPQPPGGEDDEDDETP